MAQQPLEEGFTGRAPVIATVLPRAEQARLREMADTRGLTVSALVRQLLSQALGAAKGDDKRSGTQEARGTATPGFPNAGNRQRHLEPDDRTSPCPTISTTITAPSGG